MHFIDVSVGLVYNSANISLRKILGTVGLVNISAVILSIISIKNDKRLESYFRSGPVVYIKSRARCVVA